MRQLLRQLFALLLLIIVSGTPPSAKAEGLPELGESSLADFSSNIERRIGEAEMRRFRTQEPAYINDPELIDYLDQLGARLAEHNPDIHRPIELFILRDNTLNAFAMPGGFIGVHTGLIIATQSESELASVLAHELGHVSQHHLARMMNDQQHLQIAQWLGLAVAMLAARSNSQLSQGALTTGTAVGIQAQLNYSRSFEQEADRLGMQTLVRAGFDPHAMIVFFERLQKFSRLYENDAPVYLRTHPLTNERIADIGNRVQQQPVRKLIADSLDFSLVRAKLKSEQGSTREAITEFETQLKQQQIDSSDKQAMTAHYGLARVYLRAKQLPAAEQELMKLRALQASSPLIENLAGEIANLSGNYSEAVRIYDEARRHFPQSHALLYAQLEALIVNKQPQEAINIAQTELRHATETTFVTHIAQLYQSEAKAYAALGQTLHEHHMLAEAYAVQGLLPEAIEHLELANKIGGGDFYDSSVVEARLRELRKRQRELASHETKENQKAP